MLIKLLLILFVWCSCAYAQGVGVSLSGVTVLQSGGCSRGSTLVSEDFETDYTDGEEWDEHNWVEADASTDVYLADDAVKNNGTYSGWIQSQSAGNKRIYRALSAPPGTGYVTQEFYFRQSSTNNVMAAFGIRDSSYNSITAVRFDSDGYIKYLSNATWTQLAAYSANTFYKCEIQINLDQTDGIGAVYVWIDGTEYGPYDTCSRRNPTTLHNAAVNASENTSTNTIWFDDLVVYSAARCPL